MTRIYRERVCDSHKAMYLFCNNLLSGNTINSARYLCEALSVAILSTRIVPSPIFFGRSSLWRWYQIWDLINWKWLSRAASLQIHALRDLICQYCHCSVRGFMQQLKLEKYPESNSIIWRWCPPQSDHVSIRSSTTAEYSDARWVQNPWSFPHLYERIKALGGVEHA